MAIADTTTHDDADQRTRPWQSTRLRLAALAVGLTLVLTGCFLTPPQQRAYDIANWSRTDHGRHGLAVDWDARNKAQAWAEHLAAQGVLSHSHLPDGMSGNWYALGENVGFADAGGVDAVQSAFWDSPGHRSNLLDSRWTGMGTGVAYAGVVPPKELA